MMRAVIAQLEKFGAVKRGRIGVSLQTVTPDIATALGLPKVAGAIIGAVEKGSPAERAGIKTRDVVVEIDGKAVLNASEVRNRIGLREAGSRVSLTLLREGSRQTLSLAIASSP
jgi:serine protease Do/serine protease DegQ